MTRPAYNTISISQRLKLIDFLRSKTYPDGTSARKIAEEAALSVGFPVTEHNIKSTAEAAEIELPLARAPKVDPLDELRSAITSLEQRVEALEKTQEPEDFSQLFGVIDDTATWPAGSDQPA